MRRIGLWIALVMLVCVACTSSKKSNQTETTQEMKTLVAYFSCTGNTKAVASLIANAANADLYEIQPAVAYYVFATSGSSTIDNSVAELKKTYPALNIVDGKLLTGATQETVDAWVKK